MSSSKEFVFPQEINIDEVTVSLSSPHILQDDWQYNWFDSAHKHSLLLNESYFYILSYGTNDLTNNKSNKRKSSSNKSINQTIEYQETNINKNPSVTPRLYYHQELLPPKIILAKVSLDLEILAIQLSPSNVLAIDTINKRSWIIEIRFSTDNFILQNGIIWSDHGGNSQDLILVTARGVELHKISVIRGHCKLSRVINRHIFHFWYETSHRMILIASLHKGTDDETIPSAHKAGDKVLYMDGYFFKSQPAGMLKIELPPPDKSPRFELASSTCYEDVSLVSLYGKLVCLVKVKQTNNHDELNNNRYIIDVYQISKQSIDRLKPLSINCRSTLSEHFVYSIYDNLLVCHIFDLKLSFIFDILDESQRKEEKENSCYILPISKTPLYYTDTIVKSNLYAPSCSNFAIADSTMGMTRNTSFSGGVNDIALKAALSPEVRNNINIRTSVSSHEYEEILERRNSFDDINGYNNNSHSQHFSSSPIRENFRKIYIEDYNSLLFLGVNNNNSAIKNATSNHNNNNKYKQLEKAIIATDIYFPTTYDFVDQDSLWDNNRKLMWTLSINIKTIIQNINHGKDIVLFLSRRGLKFHVLRSELPEGMLEYGYYSEDARVAKHLILLNFYKILQNKDHLSLLHSVISEMVNSYINQSDVLKKWEKHVSNDQQQQQQSIFRGGNAIIGNNNNTGDISFNKSKSMYSFRMDNNFNGNRRLSITEGLISSSKLLYRRASFSFNPNSEVDYYIDENFQINMDPLESLLKHDEIISDISIVIRKLSYFFSSNSNYSRSFKEQYRQSNPSPLTTRRDSEGNLISTQTELLEYIWIPLFYNCDSVEEIDYFTWNFTQYIFVLYENGIEVIQTVIILLINLLFVSNKHLELNSYLKMGLFNNSVEIAFVILGLYDTLLYDNRSKQCNDNNDINTYQSIRFLMLDILWHLNEKVAVMQWYINNGYIFEVLNICKNRKDECVRNSLIYGVITGTDVFQCALKAVANNKFYGDNNDNNNNNNSSFNSNNEKNRNILYAVYNFLKEFDNTLIATSPNILKSKLASESNFPSDLFQDKVLQSKFKSLFGFI